MYVNKGIEEGSVKNAKAEVVKALVIPK